MPRTDRRLAVRPAALLAGLLAATTAQAYFDPNAGGLLYQILLPIVVAITAGWRVLRMLAASLWRRIVRPRPTTAEPAAQTRSKQDGNE